MGAMAALSLNVASVLGSASTQYAQGRVARAQGQYAGRIADQNAGLAEAQAADAVARGTVAEGRFRQGTRGLIGSERATAAANGIDVGTGSAADIQANTAQLGELDALTIRNNAAREAYGYRVDAANYRAQGANARAGGANAAGAAGIGALSTLAGGAARLADQWQQNPPTFGGARNWWNTRQRTPSGVTSDMSDYR